MSAPELYRLHVRPVGLDPMPTLDYCISRGLLGIGWGVEGLEDGAATPEEYKARHIATFGGGLNSSVACFLQLNIDDLVWFRNKRGRYYLGRVTSDWRSWNEPLALELDLRNVRDAEIFDAGSEEGIPGKVISAFTAGRTLRAIRSPTARDYSLALFNRMSGRQHYQGALASGDFFEMLTADDVEDLVLLYLQKLGWMIIPSSRKRSTIRYEATLVDPLTGRRAYPQVKSGNVRLRPEDYRGPQQVFLFAGGGYEGETPENVTLVEKGELLEFCRANVILLPERVRFYFESRGSQGP